MMTKKTLGILATLALACTMSLGCSDSGGGGTTSVKAEYGKFCDAQAASTCTKKKNAAECKKEGEAFNKGLTKSTDCAGVVSAMYACLSTQKITCNDDGKPMIDASACENEQTAVNTCLEKYNNEYGCEAACKKLVPSEPCGGKSYADEEMCMAICTYGGLMIRLFSDCMEQYKEINTCEAANNQECLTLEDGSMMYASQACMSKYQALDDCLPEELKE